MKKICICLIIILNIYFPNRISAFYDADIFLKNTSETAVISKTKSGNIPLYHIREICGLLGYDVKWDCESRCAIVTNSVSKYIVTPGNDTIITNGKEEKLSSPAHLINDKTMVPLSFIELLGYKIDIDTENQWIYIIDYSGNQHETYETLFKYGIVTRQEADTDEKYMTIREVLQLFGKLKASSPDIKEWYASDETAHLDILDDEDKLLLLNLLESSWYGVLTYDDLAEIDLDKEATEFDILKFIIRFIGNKYAGGVEEYKYSEKNDVYLSAYRKGLIMSPDYTNADTVVRKKDIYFLLNTALYIPYAIPDHPSNRESYIEILEQREKRQKELNQNEQTNEKKDEKFETTMQFLNFEPEFDNNMNIIWQIPSGYDFLSTEGWHVTASFYGNDQSVCGSVGTTSKKNISAAEIIIYALSVENVKPAYVRIAYKYTDYAEKKITEYYCDFDISNIKITGHKLDLTPSAYIYCNNSANPHRLELSDGLFKKDAYYVIFSQSEKYRKKEYNTTYKTVLYTFENTPQCVVGENAATFPYAPIYFKNGYVKEFIVSGNKHSGFVVSISELSKKCFETKR